jgi:esterase/lipase superfamily enzyme/TRAP-type C4-dicarboxylate transport system substrate-binding protein
MLRLVLASLVVLTAAPASALEARVAVPAAYRDDLFLKNLAASPKLVAVDLKLTFREVADDAAAMRLVKSGEADLAAFTLADDDRKKLKMAGGEAQILTRPFIFKSAQEVFLMQKSFLGAAATADAGGDDLLPLRIWNHAITYILTKQPVRDVKDFGRLTVMAENGAPDVKILSAVGAKGVAGAANAKMGHFNAFETQASDATRDFVASYAGKLYLTVGWPVTGVLAARPDFWMRRREAEKAAFSGALVDAASASEVDVLARDAALRKLPNVEITRLDPDRQIDLAMTAAGPESQDLHNEMALWKRAEEEVHSPSRAPPPPAPPPETPKAVALSPAFFATDRNDEGGPALATRFGSRRLDPFEFSCGYLGAPKRHSGEPQIPAAARENAKGAEACAKLIVDRTRAAGAKKILILIHGFNTNFEGLLWRTLQVGSELDYDGAIVGWSWPSEGSAFSYGFDEDSNAWSEPHLAELVSEIASTGPDLQLDFVAHSMGNRILLQMLREFGQARVSYRIGAAVFAAPDVAQDIFRDQIRMAKRIGVIRTLYASQYDHAIRISESIHKAPRAGSGGDGILVVNGVDSIDARLSGHSYLFDEGKAIMDFRQVVNQATVAAERGLEKREKSGADYWVIEP